MVRFNIEPVLVSINVAGQQNKYVAVVVDVEALVFVSKELLLLARRVARRPPLRLANFLPFSLAK